MLLETCDPRSPCGGRAVSLTGDKHGHVLGRRQTPGLCPWLPAELGHTEHLGVCRCQTPQTLLSLSVPNSPIRLVCPGTVLGSVPDPWSPPGLGSAGTVGALPSPHSTQSPSHPSCSLPRLCHTGILKTELHQPPPDTST